MRYSSIKFVPGTFVATPLVYEIGISDGDDIELTHGGDLSLFELRKIEENGIRFYSMIVPGLNDRPIVDKLLIPETHQYFNAGMFIKRCRVSEGHIEGGYRVSEILYDLYDSIRKTL